MRIVLLMAAAVAGAWAADWRLTLADQYDWNGKAGFYLDLENSAPGTQPCPLATMKLALGVADGSQWRFAVVTPAWQLGREYTVTATLAPGSSRLALDGRIVGTLEGGFLPLTSIDLGAGFVPDWAPGPTGYLATQTGLTLASSGGGTVTLDFSDASRPIPLLLLAPGGIKWAKWAPGKDETWTVTASFRLSVADPRAYDPHIDRYGQSAYAAWNGKIATDTDLTSATAAEAAQLAGWGTPAGFDAYGGLLGSGWNEPATGFFRVVQKRGFWWLVTPAGNPCFYLGLDTAPALNWDRTPVTGRASMFAELPPRLPDFWGLNSWGQNDGTEDVCFNAVNMSRKYGADWKNAASDLTVRRIHAWGFSGLGKWSSDAGGLPILPVLYRDVPVLVRHPDIFDPAIQAAFRSSLDWQIRPRVQDPLVVGWSLGNEYDEIVSAQETAGMLGKGPAVAAKRALVDEALAGLYGGDIAEMAGAWGVRASTKNDLYASLPFPPATDIEHLRQFFARAYYQFIYDTVKSIDPNHLYFGFWIVPGWWENENDWRLIAPYCDAIGYDRYSEMFVDGPLDRLMRETAKPVLAGEFSFPAHYNLARGFHAYGVSVTDDAASGALYGEWLSQARRNPYCVGVAWFQYRDEPVSGRGPGQGPELVYGENYAFGMVDVGDRPKRDLVEQVRAANLEAARARLVFTPPALNEGGAVNAASFEAGAPLAPGSLMSVFGTGLDGVTLLRMGDYAVPVLYASALQINAQVPWELAGQSSTQLVASNGNAVEVPLATYSPGIFLATPAVVERGGYVTLWANGLGPVSNQPSTGSGAVAEPLSWTLDTPAVTIGGQRAAEVQFCGLAPIWVGLNQVNVRVPLDAATGDAVPIRVEIGGRRSNTVTVAIR